LDLTDHRGIASGTVAGVRARDAALGGTQEFAATARGRALDAGAAVEIGSVIRRTRQGGLGTRFAAAVDLVELLSVGAGDNFAGRDDAKDG